MGFDLIISLNVCIDPKTGKLFVFKGFEMAPFDQADYEVPEKHRKFLKQRGHHFHTFIRDFDDRQTQVEVEEFLASYPEWHEIDHEYWSEEQHKEFRDALEWMASKDHIFIVSWSY